MNLKKFFASALVVTMAVLMTAGPSMAQTNTDLYNLLIGLGIDQNTAQTIAGMGGSPVVNSGSTGTSPYTYTGLLRTGSMGVSVSNLQTCLSQAGYQPGPIDGEFGGKTRAAVMSFQRNAGGSADGVVGSFTGPRIAQACAGSVVVNPGTSVVNPPIVTSNNGQIIFQNGNFSTDIDNENVRDGEDDVVEACEQGQEILQFEFDVEDAEAGIEDVHFMFESQSGEDQPWKVFEEMTVRINGQSVMSMDTDSRNDWDDFSNNITAFSNEDEYVVSFFNVNTVVPAGEEAVITLEADIDCSADPSEWFIWVAEAPNLLDGVEIIDGSGSTHYTGSIVASEYAKLEVDVAGANADFVISESDNDPDAAVLEVSSTQNEDYVVFVFDVESEENDAFVDDVYAYITLMDSAGNDIATTTDFDEVIRDIMIDGANISDTMSSYTYVSNGEWKIAFDNVDLQLDADDIEEMEVTVEFRKIDTGDLYPGTGALISGTNLEFEVLASDHDPETADGDDITSKTGSAASETHTILTDGMTVVLDSATSSLSDTTSTTVDDKLICQFDVSVNPFNGTVYVPVAGNTGVNVDIYNANGNMVASNATSVSIVSTANQVGAGAAARYAITGNKDLEITVDYVPGPGQFYCRLTEILFSETPTGGLKSIPLTNYNTPVRVVN